MKYILSIQKSKNCDTLSIEDNNHIKESIQNLEFNNEVVSVTNIQTILKSFDNQTFANISNNKATCRLDVTSEREGATKLQIQKNNTRSPSPTYASLFVLSNVQNIFDNIPQPLNHWSLENPPLPQRLHRAAAKIRSSALERYKTSLVNARNAASIHGYSISTIPVIPTSVEDQNPQYSYNYFLLQNAYNKTKEEIEHFRAIEISDITKLFINQIQLELNESLHHHTPVTLSWG